GIRDWSVTGVQTCALPICRPRGDKRAPGLLVVGGCPWVFEWQRQALVLARSAEEEPVERLLPLLGDDGILDGVGHREDLVLGDLLADERAVVRKRVGKRERIEVAEQIDRGSGEPEDSLSVLVVGAGDAILVGRVRIK